MKHSVSDYVDSSVAHGNRVESFWSTSKPGYIFGAGSGDQDDPVAPDRRLHPVYRPVPGTLRCQAERNVGAFTSSAELPHHPSSFRRCRERIGVIPTTTLVRTTWASTAVLNSAVVIVMLATIPTDGHGVQRLRNASTPSSTFRGVVTEAIDSIREHSPMATSLVRTQACQFAALRLDSRKLGEGARKAVKQWPAALKANPDWEWARILIFLVQTALIVQGHDPGKPDGLMDPQDDVGLAGLESAVSGPPWGGNDEMFYLWGLDDNVAFLFLHGTLKAMGLSPGPRDEFLGRESVMALGRWDGTFRLAAV